MAGSRAGAIEIPLALPSFEPGAADKIGGAAFAGVVAFPAAPEGRPGAAEEVPAGIWIGAEPCLSFKETGEDGGSLRATPPPGATDARSPDAGEPAILGPGAIGGAAPTTEALPPTTTAPSACGTAMAIASPLVPLPAPTLVPAEPAVERDPPPSRPKSPTTRPESSRIRPATSTSGPPVRLTHREGEESATPGARSPTGVGSALATPAAEAATPGVPPAADGNTNAL